MNLRDLILHHKGDRTFDELEEAAGQEITSQRLQQLTTTTPQTFPLPKGIRAIATALGVNESVVILSVAESLGLDAEIPRISEALPAAASNLTLEEMAAIAHLIRAFKREEVMGNVKQHPTAIVPPAEKPAPRKVARRGGASQLDREKAAAEGQRRRRARKDENPPADEDTA